MHMDPSLVPIIVGLVSGVFGAGLTYGMLRADVVELKKDVKELQGWRNRRIEADATLTENVRNISERVNAIATKLGVIG